MISMVLVKHKLKQWDNIFIHQIDIFFNKQSKYGTNIVGRSEIDNLAVYIQTAPILWNTISTSRNLSVGNNGVWTDLVTAKFTVSITANYWQ